MMQWERFSWKKMKSNPGDMKMDGAKYEAISDTKPIRGGKILELEDRTATEHTSRVTK